MLSGGLQVQAGPCDGEEDADILYVAIDICDMFAPLPDFAWTKVAGACARTVTPMYHVLCNTFHDDMEHVAHLLAELELPPSEENVCPAHTAEAPAVKHSQPERPSRKRRRPSAVYHELNSDGQLVIPPSHPSIPTIIITLCPSQSRNPACLVPYQDASFGNRLAVPTHPALNATFPPLVAPQVPVVEHWRYESGHWRALLPDVDEQTTRGMFSRPLSTRRRRARACVADL
ncbi:hypothetical protein B0H21DRAFT_728622 [Amylocystis lapponica]|nr:hypothetical protein B0H21DRAFT_728622 [Amylocystis lapponica]